MTEFLVKIALAQNPLVPPCPALLKDGSCDVTAYTENHLIELGVNVINFMIQWLAFPLVVLFFLWGGFLLVTSGGSPNRVEQGKKAITGAIIGLVIVLTSVVVINVVLQLLVAPDVCTVDSKAKIISIGKIECPGLLQETQKNK